MERMQTTHAGKPLIIETGRIARQADGAVFMQHGETVVLVNVCYDKLNERDVDFFPLTVEYREKSAASGKFPGGFIKRENRPSNDEILRGRIVDRTIRPMFPENFKSEVQVIINVLSYDLLTPHDVLAVNASSVALGISPIPFIQPVGAVSIGLFASSDEFIINPDEKKLEEAILSLFVSGTRERVLMIEAGANEVSEETFLKAVRFAHEQIIKIIDIQQEFINKVKKEKIALPESKTDPAFKQKVYDYFKPLCNKALRVKDKLERGNAIVAAAAECYTHFFADAGIKEDDKDAMSALKKEIKPVLEAVEYDVVRNMIFDEKLRVDGRALDEIRPIDCEVGILPRTHGSSLFTRGQTQSLAMVTLGTKKDQQIVEGLHHEETRQRFMLHYNFPPYATGEVKPLRGVGRREIGHGALAEKALSYIIPSENEFPYTIRIISEIVESNGSSSMASICAGTMALMDAGVPVKKTVAGIAMGLITRGSEWEILTDIAGIEDHCGDMDFKVGGSRDGMTAVQLDVKNEGLTIAMIEKTIMQAKKARLHIISRMEAAIASPRADISPYAPRITTIQVPPDRVREIIGPGGKVIKSIVEATGADIDIEDSGKISVISINFEKAQKALKMINDIIKEIEVGEVYTGKVVRIMNFGAFVELLPGRDGLVHISELERRRVDKVEDVCNIGDEMTVKVIEIDQMKRINLSRKALLPPLEGETAAAEGDGSQRPPRRDSGGFSGRDRGNRGPRR